ncbi:ABC transporter permease [Capillimicrobium parvum]|uniref:D-allose transport system permease protein AlsC n=1 Tax=Capillimicrobium parvum TaxID=2884022 RepID=A0A9E6XU29_9ACTN|nr:ABC transporter permease [Capillimicrobium parvum]UGS34517.1 D-allose transport system permease protein AlsC [Capillimicrobium parvum]
MSADTAETPEGRETAGRRPLLRTLSRAQERLPLAQLAAIVALFIYGASTIDGFSSPGSVKSMLVLAALLGISAAGPTLVILIGGFDLAVPAYIAAGATITAQLSGASHWPFIAILAVVGAIAAVLGGLTGWLSHRFQLESMIVTLGTAALITGAILVWTGGTPGGQAPAWLSRFVSPAGTTLGVGIPPVVVLWAVLAVLLIIGLRLTVTGRRLYLTGANPTAAAYGLVRTRRMWTGTFALGAVLSAVTGVLLGGFAGGGDLAIGNPYLFQGLAAIIVGGVAFGAVGGYANTVVGALLLTVLTTILVGKGAGTAEQLMLSGVLIALVVGVHGRERRVRDRV